MPHPARSIDLTTFTTPQLEQLTSQPGPMRQLVRRELDRRAEHPAGPLALVTSRLSSALAGEIALELLTEKQRKELDARLVTADAEKEVEQAQAVLAAATEQVVTAATGAQKAIHAAPKGVDTAELAAAVAVVQPVLDSAPDAAAKE